jgi:digeranylgeranylglycerophospholipid reductase
MESTCRSFRRNAPIAPFAFVFAPLEPWPLKSATYDVLIVGAGPAGSICARNLARLGYHVLLCEKRPVVGVPVRCGEATGTRTRLSEFLTVSESWIETTLHGVIMHGTGGVTLRHDANKEIGVMLDRALFDQDLARQAVAEGAELVCDARVSAVSTYVPNHGRQVTVQYAGVEHTLHAKIVIGADGAESLTGRWVGLKTRQLPPHTCSAIELRVDAMDANPNHLTFWQGHDSINKGYIWVFPKLKSGVVNLGSGELVPKLGAKNMYDLSMEYKHKLYPDAKVLAVHGGCVPVSGNLSEYTADGFLLVGDAAHHTNPLTGGGIMASIVGADTAATWVHEALRTKQFEKAFLQGYEADCWDRFGRNHYRQMRIRDFVVAMPAASQKRFYTIFKGMIDGGLKKPALWLGYAKMVGLAIKHWPLLKPVLQAGRFRPYGKASSSLSAKALQTLPDSLSKVTQADKASVHSKAT